MVILAPPPGCGCSPFLTPQMEAFDDLLLMVLNYHDVQARQLAAGLRFLFASIFSLHDVWPLGLEIPCEMGSGNNPTLYPFRNFKFSRLP